MSASLVAYNALLNRRSTDAWWYVPANLALAGGCLGVARVRGIPAHDVGMDLSRLRERVRPAVPLAATAAALLAVATWAPATRGLVADERAAGVAGSELVRRALVRIPVGTALVEETVFRGVLEGMWGRALSPAGAAVATNVAFGLWHVGPGRRTLETNGVRGAARALALAGIVVGTAAGGLFLSSLRRRTGSVAAPAVLHASVNATALVAAVAAHRLSRPRDDGRTARA